MKARTWVLVAVFVVLTLINSIGIAWAIRTQIEHEEGIETIAWYVRLHHFEDDKGIYKKGSGHVPAY
jgi:hypothetical protein